MAGIIDYILVAVLFAGAIFLLYKNIKTKDWFTNFYGSSAVLSALSYLIASATQANGITVMLYNLFVFMLGVGTIVYGIRKQRMGTTNGGMFILSLLIVLRFFDSDLGFLFKGLSFIIVGVGFIVSNAVLFNRKKGVAIDEKAS